MKKKPPTSPEPVQVLSTFSATFEDGSEWEENLGGCLDEPAVKINSSEECLELLDGCCLGKVGHC